MKFLCPASIVPSDRIIPGIWVLCSPYMAGIHSIVSRCGFENKALASRWNINTVTQQVRLSHSASPDKPQRFGAEKSFCHISEAKFSSAADGEATSWIDCLYKQPFTPWYALRALVPCWFIDWFILGYSFSVLYIFWIFIVEDFAWACFVILLNL